MYAIEAESIVNDMMEQNMPLDKLLEKLELRIISRSENKVEFDLKNAHPSLANALRRIMISEVPTIAFHNLTIVENDTVFPDEYIAHRIGLIPIDVDPSGFSSDDESNKLRFRLNIQNRSKEIIPLYSDSIEWIRDEDQQNISVKIKPGVLICKMAPGNTIIMEIEAEKGIGKKHAKWSPVSICTYRLMPKIVIEKDFYGEDAKELQGCFNKGVIGIADGKAFVENPRLDMISREVFRHDKFKNDVKMFREDGWYCFTIESIVLDPIYILKDAIRVLKEKCRVLRESIFELEE